MANDLLKEEYFWLQRIIEDFDTKSLEIKKWSVGLVSASALANLTTHSNAGLIAGAVAAIGFWIIDATWKTFQQGFLPRLRHIEEQYAKGVEDQCKPLQVTTSWRENVGRRVVIRDTIEHMFWGNVCLPHVVVLVIAIVAFFLPSPMTAP